MNTQRLLILGVAVIAAGAAALLARGLLGGGTEKAKAYVPPPRVVTSEVLVAASDIPAGSQLTATSVRWQEWPKSSVDSSFVTRETGGDVDHFVQGTVVRTALVAGQPVTSTEVVHADSAGFLAAMVDQGMRAISIGITTESDAGGFILPNDRVDVLLVGQVSEQPRRFRAFTILRDVRVLAVDQTYHQDKDQKTVLAKTATLELAPAQAELIETAQAMGTITLSLRALGDMVPHANGHDETADNSNQAGVVVIKYGVPQVAAAPGD
jgi:pilus assembly protein CpaB